MIGGGTIYLDTGTKVAVTIVVLAVLAVIYVVRNNIDPSVFGGSIL